MFHLVCIHPFGKYERGQVVTDQEEVKALMADRDHQFVRRNVPDEPAPVVESPPVKK